MDKYFIHTHWNVFLIFSSIGLFPLSINKRTFYVEKSRGKIIYWIAMVLLINSVCFYQFKLDSITVKSNGFVVKLSKWCVNILIWTDINCALLQCLINRQTHMQLLNDIDVMDFIINNKYATHLSDRKVKQNTMTKLLFLEGIWIIMSIIKIFNHNDKMAVVQERLSALPIFWLTNVRLIMVESNKE